VDGTGYPDGLKGDEIDLSSQIVSIADAYDAMTSVRSYRKPLTPGDAAREIERARGLQFPPRSRECISQSDRPPRVNGQIHLMKKISHSFSKALG